MKKTVIIIALILFCFKANTQNTTYYSVSDTILGISFELPLIKSEEVSTDWFEISFELNFSINLILWHVGYNKQYSYVEFIGKEKISSHSVIKKENGND